jgi:hypothetical protein
MENEYRANDNSLFIPTKKLKIFPDAQGVDIKANGKGTSQFIFTLPDYLNFVNPETLRLRFDLQMAGRGMGKPDPAAATSSLFRHMRVQTQNGLNLLEEVAEYSSRVAMEYSYGQDDGVIHNRELNEGLSLTDNSAQQLFWNAQPLPSANITAPNTSKKVAISLPLWSGILGPDASVLPVAALGGVKLTMETNNLKKSIRLANDSKKGGKKSLLVKTEVTAANWNNADVAYIQDIVCKGTDAQDSGFEVGDSVYFSVGNVDTLIGLVVSVGNAAGDYVLKVKGDVAVSTDWKLLAVDTELYTLPKDRFEGWSPGTNMQGGGANVAINLAVAQAAVKVDYTITDLEMICEQVQPPESYVNDMIKKINSSSGLVMNYKNTTLHKVNLVGTTGLLNASIPNTSKRVYSINAMPLASTDTYDAGNLTAKPDSILSYEFVINDQLVPDQKVPLSRLSMTPAYVEQLHLQELRKSLINSGVFVKSLQNAEKNFIIGRAVSLFGSVSDITKSDLSLRMEYGSTASYQKTLNVYACTARTLVIQQNNIEVVY